MLLVFFYYVYLFSSWSFYRLLTNFSEPIDEFIFKPVVWVLPIFILVVMYERRSISKSLGLDFSDVRQDAIFGGTMALLVYGFIIAIIYFKFGFLHFNPLNLNGWGMATFLFTSLATAITEEITFRGFILTRLADSFKSKRLANIITTIIFLVIHLPIYTFTHALNTVEIVNVMLLSGIISLVDGYLFYRRKGITAPIASHAVWNFVAVIIR